MNSDQEVKERAIEQAAQEARARTITTGIEHRVLVQERYDGCEISIVFGESPL
jgi:hypothetical protein